MSQPVQVEVFFPEQPFGGVLVQFPGGLEQIAINTGSPITSVFGRIGNVTAQCGDYDQCYAPLGSGLPPGGTDGQVLTKQGDAPFDSVWAPSAGGGGAGFNTANYRFKTGTGASDPGSGFVKFNNATPSLVTAFYINSLSGDGVDIDAFLALLASGDIMAIQDKDDSLNAFRFNISGAPTDNTGWWTIPVTFVEAQGSLPANNEHIVVMAQMSKPGGTIAATSDILQGDGAGNAVQTGLAPGDLVVKTPGYPTPTNLNQVIQCLKDAGLCAP